VRWRPSLSRCGSVVSRAPRITGPRSRSSPTSSSSSPANLLVAFAQLPLIRSGEWPSLPAYHARLLCGLARTCSFDPPTHSSDPSTVCLILVVMILVYGAGMATNRSVDILAEADLKGKKVFRQGGFGPVYRSRLEDSREVAVKLLGAGLQQGVREFCNEATLQS
jgi:hypothetical protein